MTYTYRITFNGANEIFNTLPTEQWTRIAQVCEDRGLVATLERRLITDASILPLLVDPTGYIRLKDKVFCPWSVLAQVRCNDTEPRR